MKIEDQHTPDPVDIHVGQRVRGLRKLHGLSQSHLAAHLELTFQQIQKYERGVNRVSASKMYAMAGLFKVSPAYFFDGLPSPETGEGGPDPLQAFVATEFGVDMVEDFMACSPRDQLAIRNLARTLSGKVRELREVA